MFAKVFVDTCKKSATSFGFSNLKSSELDEIELRPSSATIRKIRQERENLVSYTLHGKGKRVYYPLVEVAVDRK